MIANVRETKIIYKMVDVTSLKLHLFLPQNSINPSDQRSAIVFFHGGRFSQGHPAQFFPHCRHLASHGLVAASAEYRLLGKNTTSIRACLADGKSVIRWLRVHADCLAIAPTQIIAAGGSAGANIAANTAMMNNGDEIGEDLTISSKPNALILFSPAIIRPNLAEDLIDEQLYTNLSVKAQLPPMLLLHGTEDEFFSVENMMKFCEQMLSVGNLCELKLFHDGKHGFFNYGRDENRPFYETLLEVDSFLYKYGMLKKSSIISYYSINSLRNEFDWKA